MLITPGPIYARKIQEKTGQKEPRLASETRDRHSAHAIEETAEPGRELQDDGGDRPECGSLPESKQMAFDPAAGHPSRFGAAFTDVIAQPGMPEERGPDRAAPPKDGRRSIALKPVPPASV